MQVTGDHHTFEVGQQFNNVILFKRQEGSDRLRFTKMEKVGKSECKYSLFLECLNSSGQQKCHVQINGRQLFSAGQPIDFLGKISISVTPVAANILKVEKGGQQRCVFYFNVNEKSSHADRLNDLTMSAESKVGFPSGEVFDGFVEFNFTPDCTMEPRKAVLRILKQEGEGCSYALEIKPSVHQGQNDWDLTINGYRLVKQKHVIDLLAISSVKIVPVGNGVLQLETESPDREPRIHFFTLRTTLQHPNFLLIFDTSSAAQPEKEARTIASLENAPLDPMQALIALAEITDSGIEKECYRKIFSHPDLGVILWSSPAQTEEGVLFFGKKGSGKFVRCETDCVGHLKSTAMQVWRLKIPDGTTHGLVFYPGLEEQALPPTWDGGLTLESKVVPVAIPVKSMLD